MAKVKTRIELNQKDILGMVAREYNLKLDGATISVSHYKGDGREPEHTSIIIEAEKA